MYIQKGAPPRPNLHDVEKNIYNKLTSSNHLNLARPLGELVVFTERVKTRASLFCIPIVTDYAAVIHLAKIVDELGHRGFLFPCPCVAGLAVSVEPADVRNADRVRVMTLAVCARLADSAASFHGAVFVDNVMIADVTKPSHLFMIPPYVRGFQSATSAVSGAVNDDLVYQSHITCAVFV